MEKLKSILETTLADALKNKDWDKAAKTAELLHRVKLTMKAGLKQ